ncbi:ABC transporter permease [Ornithinibacillus xuwenensis]|uniref:ABC transporter permease n=1 Tax=Ornithinibacillus xuwenensis TaxID=3144668 RepID=A0ABU9XKA0_9BACI
MGSFIKKDLLLFWRDRKELITVLVLPILLVVVLNFAFAGLLSDNANENLDLQLAVVNQDNELETLARLKEKLMEEGSVSNSEAEKMVEQASQLSPIPLLFNYLESDELKSWVTVHELEEGEAVKKVEDGEIDGILTIPSGFTVDSLYAALAGEVPATSLKFKMERETNNNSILFDMIHGFTDHLNFQFVVQEIGASDAEVFLPEGGFEKVGTGESFTLSQYFTIAMGALFALFLASTVATKTGLEIRQKVFYRIQLTNSNPILFLIGKMVSTFCLAWLQIMFVFVFSHFILDVFSDRTTSFWLGVIGIVTILSLAIAALAAVFTSISLRITNIDAANGIFMLVILFFGVVGGNFVPIYILPSWLQKIGEWTPNGSSLVALTNWIQYEELSSIVTPSLFLIGFFLLFTVVSVAIYPKRGKTS